MNAPLVRVIAPSMLDRVCGLRYCHEGYRSAALAHVLDEGAGGCVQWPGQGDSSYERTSVKLARAPVSRSAGRLAGAETLEQAGAMENRPVQQALSLLHRHGGTTAGYRQRTDVTASKVETEAWLCGQAYLPLRTEGLGSLGSSEPPTLAQES